MAKGLTREEFIVRSKKTHGDRYNYSLSEYINVRTKVKIICKNHGEFDQWPKSHYLGAGCPKCNIDDLKYSTEEFIEKSKEIHGNKYDYSKSIYIDAKSKLKIICPIHGEFKQNSRTHYRGFGCSKCGTASSAMKRNKSTEIFIKQAIEVHGDLYNYDNTIYVNHRIKLLIRCLIHGEFKQRPDIHLANHGCPKCATKKKSRRLKEFIKISRSIHGNRYNYDKVQYINGRVQVKIVCQEHGVFMQLPRTHIKGQGCPSCAREIIAEKKTYSTSEFIEKAIQIHGSKYDYSKVIYSKSYNLITIICRKHGEFVQMPSGHLGGAGCPNCNRSRGESLIKVTLELNDSIFTEQKSFPNLKSKKGYKMKFDFYVTHFDKVELKTPTLIEYHGKQHFEFYSYFHKVIKHFEYRKECDRIKKEFAQRNFSYLEIPCKSKNDIPKILVKHFEKKLREEKRIP